MHLIAVDAKRFVKVPLSSLAGISVVVVVVIYIYIFFVVIVILFLFSFRLVSI